MESLSSVPIDRADLRRLIGEPHFSRGAAYDRRGMVLAAELDASRKHAKGTVAGTERKPYTQDITLLWHPAGQLLRIDGSCTCPIGRNCKHVAAVMLSLLPELNRRKTGTLPQLVQAKRPDAGEPEVAGYLAGWLGRLNELDAPVDQNERKSGSSAERLYYLLKPDPMGKLEFELFKIRQLKSGELSKRPQSFSPGYDIPTGAFVQFEDIPILGKLRFLTQRGPEGGPGFRLDARKFERDTLVDLVKDIIATGRARALTLQHPALQWSSPRRAHFAWQEKNRGEQSLILLDDNERELEALPTLPPLYVDTRDGACGEIESEANARLALELLSMPPVPAEAVRKITSSLSRFRAVPPPKQIEIVTRDDVRPTPVLRLLSVDGRMSPYSAFLSHRRGYRFSDYEVEHVTIPILRPGFDYDGHHVTPHAQRDPQYRDGDRQIVIRRDQRAERKALERLRELEEYGVSEIDDVTKEIYDISGAKKGDLMFEVESELHLTNELALVALTMTRDALEPMKAEGWRIEFDDSWPYRFRDDRLEISASVEKSQTDWFSFSLTAIAGQQELDLLPLVLQIVETLDFDIDGDDDEALDAILDDMILFLNLPDGSRLPVEGAELAPLIRACMAARALLAGFHPGEAGEVTRLAEALEGSGIRFQGSPELLELGRRLRALREMPEVLPPSSLKAELRPYQKSGYGWLRALAGTGFGGVLADDMGLGKTVQALALLCERHLEQEADRPSLLVVPTSLIGNWQREAARFAPDLRLLILHGPDRRKHFERIPDHHLIVTTYPLLHRDRETLFTRPFELAILDEAQAVKNPASAAAKLIREIDARQRLALTGTPIENNLEELWAIYDWVVPGLLGNRKTFRETFRHRIERSGDVGAGRRLAGRIRPFLLRRTKEQVATDLPPKTELDEIISLQGKQRDLYETVRVAMDARVREAIARDGLASTRITVLDALLKMRQACCDPRLVKLDEAAKVKESAKRARLLEMLEELLAEGRKVLVFSQFVEMLSLIEQDLKERGIDYALLTGETKKRAAVIDRFQSGEVPLFLISLKAGGVGLNLTAADTVIIYDPWWNPAVERQAMDRTHRIGQDKPVFVYRLIAEGSVEAAIQSMQKRKQALADNLFAGTGKGGLAIDEGDIEALFAPL